MDVDFEDFYAERVLQFERERKVFRDYADLITPDRNESHTLEWENKKLCNNAGEVKNEVDRYAKESRILESQISAAMDEINGLKSAREARQEQITRLSKLSNPVQRDVTYLIEERFNVRETGALMKSEPMMANIPPAYKSLKTGEILQLERRLQHESLKTSTYLQDVQIAIREAEEERYRYRKMKLSSTETDLTEAKRLYLAVDELEAQSFLAVSELLRLRVSILIAQREEVEQLELLQRDKAYFIEKEEKTRQQLISDMSLMQKRVKQELQECTRDFQKQLSELNVKLKALHLKEEWIQAEHVKQDTEDTGLLELVEQAKKRYHSLRRRNALEMEGYQTEAAQLRARLQHVDKLYNAHLLNPPTSSRAATTPRK